MDDVHALQRQLIAKPYGYARPQVETMPWGLDLSVKDPFGNRLTFTSD